MAFTNPTAGPWKLLIGQNAEGTWGEVMRFQRESLRPDLVCYNDSLETVAIVEAKGSPRQLLVPRQVAKSTRAVRVVGEHLRTAQDNPHWGQRSGYRVYCGILWGAEGDTTPETANAVLQAYSAALPDLDWLSTTTLALECRRAADQEGIIQLGYVSDPADHDAVGVLTSMVTHSTSAS